MPVRILEESRHRVEWTQRQSTTHNSHKYLAVLLSTGESYPGLVSAREAGGNLLGIRGIILLWPVGLETLHRTLTTVVTAR